MIKKEIRCKIDEEIVEKLDLVLQLNKVELDEVVENLLANYISESFLKAAKGMNINTPKTNVLKTPYLSDRKEDTNYGKANRKIPVWAKRPNQNNHKIIKAFLLIEEEKGEVTYEELLSRCSDRKNYPETFINDFRGNFAQMKTDASNSHGKVFVIEEENVEIWEEVMETLMKYRDIFLCSEDKGANTVKITNEMIQGAYKIAKMVYVGDISRTDGKYKITQETGMSSGSAGDYISDFLYMMQGRRYTRTLSAYATKYYLENIRKDFGEDQFRIALDAVKMHIQYYNGLPYGNLNKIQEIVDELVEVTEC